MFRIDDTTAIATLPALPTDNVGTPGFFTGGSTSGTAPTRVRFWWLNQIQEELVSIVLAAGIALAKGTNQVLAALKTLFVQQGGGINQRAIGTHVITLGLSSASSAVRATVDTTDIGELAAFGNGNLSLGAWTEHYTTLPSNGSETITLNFTAPRPGMVLVLASANLSGQASGNSLLSVACNGTTGSSDSVANTTAMSNHSCFSVAAGPVSVSSYFGVSSSTSTAVGHTLSYLFVPG